MFKKGDSSLLVNYRPISLLPTISKVFERVIHDQMYEYFNQFNLLAEQQYGFRKQHSTEYAAVKLIIHISKEMEAGKTPMGVYIDLSKAFDTLTFEVLFMFCFSMIFHVLLFDDFYVLLFDDFLQ